MIETTLGVYSFNDLVTLHFGIEIVIFPLPYWPFIFLKNRHYGASIVYLPLTSVEFVEKNIREKEEKEKQVCLNCLGSIGAMLGWYCTHRIDMYR